jgi:hypothetical protein
MTDQTETGPARKGSTEHAPAVPPPAVDRTNLRDRIAGAIHADLLAHAVRRDQGLLGIVPRLADAVLAVFPEPDGRAAVYAEVADRLAADAEKGGKEGFTRIYRRSAAKQVRDWADELRRTSDEAQQPEPDTCRPIEVDSEIISVRGSGDMTEQEQGYVAEIVRAAKRKYAAEHPNAEAQQGEEPSRG